jgi:hypothetical protein
VNFYNAAHRALAKFHYIGTCPPFSQMKDALEVMARIECPKFILCRIRDITRNYFPFRKFQLIVIQGGLCFGDHKTPAPFRCVWVCVGMELPQDIMIMRLDPSVEMTESYMMMGKVEPLEDLEEEEAEEDALAEEDLIPDVDLAPPDDWDFEWETTQVKNAQ